jgi:hypothetical protein
VSELIFWTGWPVSEVEKLTIAECIGFVEEFRRIDAERMKMFLKGFSAHNLASTRLAFSGSKNECEQFLKKLEEKECENVSDIDSQFTGLNFES